MITHDRIFLRQGNSNFTFDKTLGLDTVIVIQDTILITGKRRRWTYHRHFSHVLDSLKIMTYYSIHCRDTSLHFS